MKLFLPKYPSVLKWCYPERITRVNRKNTIYLTFDDGPVPDITPWVLEELRKWNAKATFFCIGENVKKHPSVFRQVIQQGHCIGNHTYNHLNGWKTSTSEYLENTIKAEKTLVQQFSSAGENISENQLSQLKIFRPPYGKIKNSQARVLVNEGFKIVMWDVISGDYNQDYSAEECFRNVIDHAVEGSSIVFHDSIKASDNLKVILPKILKYYSEKGYEFRSLTDVL